MYCLSPGLAFSETDDVNNVKLSCNIKHETQYSTGEVETKNFTEIFEIHESPRLLTIRPTSDAFFGVASIAKETIVSANNYSNGNKWEIANTIKFDSETAMDIRIRIDRNTGQIFITDTLVSKGKTTGSKANGICKKIDTAMKKF